MKATNLPETATVIMMDLLIRSLEKAEQEGDRVLIDRLKQRLFLEISKI
jgi:hypothetical protein